MRTIHSDLKTAQENLTQFPIARVTVRDIRLRFSTFVVGDNPWFNQDAPLYGDEKYVYGDSLTVESGTILRSWANTILRVQKITAPTTAAQWDDDTNAWASTGITPTAGSNPGLVEDVSTNPNTVYLFYIRSGTLRYITSTDDGGTWAGETNTTLAVPGVPTVAPVTKDEIFICTSVSNTVRMYRAVNNSGWSIAELPHRLHSNGTHAILAPEYNSVTYFDAFALGGKSWIVFTFGDAGKTWLASYENGVMGDPRLLLPDDYSRFVGYRASVIDGKVWLTGRLERVNAAGYSPEFDVYLYSSDGELWTAINRNAFICEDELRGKLLLSGTYVYYVGPYTIMRAPATYLINPTGDPAGMKLVISGEGGGDYDDLLAASVDYPSAGMAPQMGLELATGDDSYIDVASSKVGVIKPGSEIWLEAGYKTATGNRYALLLQANIDQPPVYIGDAMREMSLSARCSQFKSLRDWSSLFYFEMLSQHKHFDPCDRMDKLYIMNGGDYRTLSDNLVLNGDFETDLYWWLPFSTGSAAGAHARSAAEQQAGDYAYKITRTPTANTEHDYGVYTTFNVLAGESYRATIFYYVASISGGAETVKARVSGNWGTGGSSEEVVASAVGTNTFWESFVLEFTAETSAVVVLSAFFDSANAGEMYIDSVEAVQTSLGFIKFVSQDVDGILFSTTPFDAADFDVRVRMTDVATAEANIAEMGLIGLASDKSNFIALIAKRGANTLDLVRIRNGNRLVLQTITGPNSLTLAANTPYDFRLIHRAGRFLGYIKEASSADWGAAAIDYQWAQPDAPCLTANGRGKMGVFTKIRPYKFLAYGIDLYSELVVMRSPDMDWTSFPSSGIVLWDDEQITFTNKTGSSIIYPVVHGICADRAIVNYQTMDEEDWEPLGWNNRLDVNAVDPTLTYTHFAIIAPNGGEPYAAWRITDSFDTGNETAPNPPFNQIPPPGGNLRLQTHESGHDGTFPGGDPSTGHGRPNYHGIGGPGMVIAPCLYGCTRGANGTEAQRHADLSYPYLYADDEIRIDNFEFYDYEHDYSTEDLLRRVNGYAGVLNTEFDDAFAGGPYTINPGSSFYNGQFLGNFDNKDVDLRFNWSHDDWASGNARVGAIVHATTQDTSTLTGHIVYLSRGSGTYRVSFSRLVAGLEVSLYTAVLPAGFYPVGTGTHSMRVVATGNTVAVYSNGRLIATFYDDTLASNTHNYVAVGGLFDTIAVSNVRIPELHEWREAVYFDNDSSAIAALGKIIDDRPIYYISRSGTAIKYSSFDSRDDAGTFTDMVLADSSTPNDTDVFSFVRVYAEEIMEHLDSDLAKEHGLIMMAMHMPNASTATAANSVARLFRRARETLAGRTQEIPAHLHIECEDKFEIDYVASATGLEVTETLIANSINISYSAQPELVMSISSRKWVS